VERQPQDVAEAGPRGIDFRLKEMRPRLVASELERVDAGRTRAALGEDIAQEVPVPPRSVRLRLGKLEPMLLDELSPDEPTDVESWEALPDHGERLPGAPQELENLPVFG
jgi:hypothetical protein